MKRQAQRPLGYEFPHDFPERLERFRDAAGLSWRSLARLLGVTPYRLREWRRGAVPSGAHLFALLALAGELGVRDGILLCAQRNPPRGKSGSEKSMCKLFSRLR